MTFGFAMTAATDYWAKRGVDIPCHLQAHTLTTDEMTQVVDAYGTDTYVLYDIPACAISLTPEAEENRRDAPLSYCYAVQYAAGYIAGAGDAAEAIRHVPWGCVHPFTFRRWWDHTHSPPLIQPTPANY